MRIIKKKLDIDETLNQKIKNALKFLNIKEKIQKGNILKKENENIQKEVKYLKIRNQKLEQKMVDLLPT